MTIIGRKPPPPSYPKEIITLGDHLRKRRLDLGMRPREVARIFGVTASTIVNWERNRTAPPLRFVPAIVRFLGYVPPEPTAVTLGQRRRAYRRLREITQTEMARRLGVDPSTLSRWERGKGGPSKSFAKMLSELLGPACLS